MATVLECIYEDDVTSKIMDRVTEIYANNILDSVMYTGTNSIRSQFYYNEDRTLKQKKQYRQNGDLIFKFEYEYTCDGKNIKERTYNSIDELICVYTMMCNNDGQIIKAFDGITTEIYEYTGNTVTKTVLKKGTKLVITESSLSDEITGLVFSKKVNRMKYDENNALVYDILDTTFYKYDERNNVTQEKIKSVKNGKQLFTHTLKYFNEYDAQNRLTRVQRFSK